MNRPLHAVLFCRSNRGSVSGLQAQEDRCRRKATEAGATDIVTIVDDQGGPADMGRPAIAELRKLIDSGSIDLVVVESSDRLTRRIFDLRELMRDVSRAGARLMFVSP